MAVPPSAAQTPGGDYSFDHAQKFMKTYCVSCHQGKAAAGGLNAADVSTPESFTEQSHKWNEIVLRVKNGEMPPKNAPSPDLDTRETFTDWVQGSLRAAACAEGVTPGRFPIRRLSRTEYAATMRDLLNLHVDVSGGLPADGAGGEGFDNAAETLFLSPIHAEAYLDAAKLALGFASKDPRSRAKFLVAAPGEGVTEEQAARQILEEFLPRAFRRPATKEDVAEYMAIFKAAQKQGEPFEDSISLALRGVLIAPQFLFRAEPPNSGPEERLLDDYALATRLSYFLWGSMPDSLLIALAEEGKLQDPEVLKNQVARMLRNEKSFEFMQSFVEQWLRTRELGQTIKPDPELFPEYEADAELRGDIRYQPVLFFREILANDLSLLNLIDSNFTIMTRKLQRLYGTNLTPPRAGNQAQPQRVELPKGTHRGGLLGMTAVLAVSSYPHRTSPVLRGKWLLEAVLGTPPPPPPPDVPELEEVRDGVTTATLRERLTQHSENPVCASCHSRIDPLGFALENYDVLGRYRTEDSGAPIDSRGELPDGTSFEGANQLKAVLLDRKELFLRNLTNKVLGYGLGRGLTLEDSCTVDSIMAELERNDYSAHTLINAVVMSKPFRYQMGTQVQVSSNSEKTKPLRKQQARKPQVNLQ